MSAPRILLGPQRTMPILGDAVAALGVKGKLAAVTAGWEEREDEDRELAQHLGGRTVSLRLFDRAEDVFQKDPAVLQAMSEHHSRLHGLRDVYRKHLGHALEAARELTHSTADSRLIEAELDASAMLAPAPGGEVEVWSGTIDASTASTAAQAMESRR